MLEQDQDTDEVRRGDPKELARRVLLIASYFAGEVIARYAASYPEQAAALGRSGCEFAVRVSSIMSDRPRVSLMAVGNGEECEVAHVELKKGGTVQ